MNSPEYRNSVSVLAIAQTRMTFEELVLRFFALDEGILTYRPSLKVFLNHFMRDHREPGDDELDQRRQRFITTVERVLSVYGAQSFRRVYRRDDGTIEISTAVNSALYDALILNFARLDASPDQLKAEADAVTSMTDGLMLDNGGFIDAISLATGDRLRLHRRVRILGEHLGALGFESGLAGMIVDAAAEEAEQPPAEQ